MKYILAIKDSKDIRDIRGGANNRLFFLKYLFYVAIYALGCSRDCLHDTFISGRFGNAKTLRCKERDGNTRGNYGYYKKNLTS